MTRGERQEQELKALADRLIHLRDRWATTEKIREFYELGKKHGYTDAVEEDIAWRAKHGT